MKQQTMFDRLAGLHVKIQSADKTPRQWIYAVDDAWFHPEGVTIQKDGRTLNPVFPHDLVGQTVPIQEGLMMPMAQQPGNQDADVLSAAAEGVPASPLEESLETKLRAAINGAGGGENDIPTAKALLRFLLENHGDYGLCFCSFEYFWKNAKEINEPQNAVFFDLKHIVAEGLPAGSGVADRWTTLLSGLFPQSATLTDRLGWMLHYAFKFGRVPGAEPCQIAHDHLLIISSAIAPTSLPSGGAVASPSRDAIGQFLEIQGEIFSCYKGKEAAALPAHIVPTTFSWAPLPKRSESFEECLKIGLAIFNNSFGNAASWPSTQKLLLKDVESIYTEASNGHFASAQAANRFGRQLKWKTWHPENRKSVFDPLYKTYDSPELSINHLLTMLSHSGVREFPRHWSGFDNKKVTLPTVPGLFFVYHVIDFIHELEPKDEGRKPPQITYSLDDIQHHFNINIKLDVSGLKGLKYCYQKEKKPNGQECGGAALALLRLGKNRVKEAAMCPLAKLLGSQPTFCSNFPEIVFDENSGKLHVCLASLRC